MHDRPLHRLATVALVAAVSLVAGSAAANPPPPLTLSKTPLFLAQSVEPNVFITLDDSGSMREAYFPGPVASVQDVWIDPEQGTSSAAPRYRRCGWQIERFYSPDTNDMYYNPDITYEPPLRWDGTRFPDADFNAAWVDGISANAGGLITPAYVVDLATQYFPTIEVNIPFSINQMSVRPEYPSEWLVRQHFVVRHDPNFPSATQNFVPTCSMHTATWRLPFATVTNGVVSSAPFYYRYKASAPREADGSITNFNMRRAWHYDLHPISPAERQNFANWYSYYRSRYLAAKSAVSILFATRVSGVRIAWQNQEQHHLVPGTSVMRNFDDPITKQVFFHWLFTHRMTGDTPTRAAAIRVGQMLSANPGVHGSSNPFWDPERRMELSCRPNYHLIVTDGYWNEPPLSPTLVPNHDRKPITLPEPNDHMSYEPDGGYMRSQKIFWAEPDGGATPSLADIAFHYWVTDARPDLPNNVPPRWADLETGVTTNLPMPTSGVEAAQNHETFWNPKNNPARHQHLVTYAISYGERGTLRWSSDPTQGDYAALRAGGMQWPLLPSTVSNGLQSPGSTGIDDLWHATINSRGEFYLAKDPQELAASLSRFLEVLDEQRGTAAATTVSSGVATAKTLAFRAGYDTTDWSGYVQAHRLAADGSLQQPALWDANERLSASSMDPDRRRILTSASASGTGRPFRWPALPADYRALLDVDPLTGLPDGLGAQRLEFLRGDDSMEADKPGGRFRVRRNRLGAIAHASSVFVAAPSGGYDDSRWPQGSPERAAADIGRGYAKFVADRSGRRRQLIVGANDGMLHAFNAGFAAGDDPGNGDELWAYVPRKVAHNLSRATRRGIYFEPFVDASVVVRDAYLGSAKGWRTVLVGGLRRGGQGYFALDITDPDTITEANAGNVVLWEYSDDVPGGEDVGYSYGVPNISRLANGRWVAVLSGGYNSQEPDDATGTGMATMFVIDLATGDKLHEFKIPSATGLGPVTMGDLEGDGIDDFAVAGTLEGDLYHFDLSHPSPAAWPAPTLVFRGERVDGVPTRPITSAPRIFGDTATGHAMLLFGTGKMLEPQDPRDDTQQAFYAIRLDGGSYPIRQDDLAPRSVQRTGTDGRHFSIDGTAAADATGVRGWYFLLGSDARDHRERVISTPGAHFSSGAVLIATIVPNGGDPCLGNQRGNFYLLDASSGSAVQGRSIADTNNDGRIDEQDDAVGIAFDQMAPSGTPAIVERIGGGAATIPDLPGAQLPTPTWRRRNQGELQ